MEKRKYILVTLYGEDRTGIVEAVSAWILEEEGNIEDSRMSRLGGEFAALILVSGDQGLLERLAATRESFEEKHSLNVITKEVPAGPTAPVKPALRYVLKAASMDHPGIVHKVSRLLGMKGINIVAANTYNESAPFSGVPVFHLEMKIEIPASISLVDLREELKNLGYSDNIDIVLSPE